MRRSGEGTERAAAGPADQWGGHLRHVGDKERHGQRDRRVVSVGGRFTP